MKSLKFVLLLALAATFVACSNSGEQNTTNTNLGPAPAPIDPTTVAPPTVPDQPAMNAAGVYHYTCPNGCTGGAGSAQPCATCGSMLAHNQAYHNTSPAQTFSPTNTPQQQQSPAQNSVGVYHYTCPSGCAGGAGSAQPCGTCGSMLAHNQAYHDAPPASTTTPNPGAKSPLFVN